MQDFLYYIRDHLVGTHYFIYAFILLFFMFAIIGYLFKEKYGKYDIKLKTSQEDGTKENKESTKEVKNKTKKITKSTDIESKNQSVDVQNNQDVQQLSTLKTKETNDVENIVNNSETVEVKPMPSPEKPPVNPTPMPNTKEVINPTPIPNPVTKQSENEPIPEI